MQIIWRLDANKWYCWHQIVFALMLHLASFQLHVPRRDCNISVALQKACNWPNSQIPECTHSISHNVPFWMEHCGVWNRCFLGFVKLDYQIIPLCCTVWSIVIPQYITVYFTPNIPNSLTKKGRAYSVRHCKTIGPRLNVKMVFPGVGIYIIKIRCETVLPS